MHYVYKITNKINGKIYIGKRKHHDPLNDPYMGSGKLIKSAIKKYGKDSFEKEILSVFQTNDEAAELEAKLVTKEFIAEGKSYNMHEGGHGGFAHINKFPIEERINVKSFKEKYASGLLKNGGDKSSFFTEESYKKIREGSVKGNEVLKNRSEEEKNITRKKMSKSALGPKNSQFGTKFYVNPDNPKDKKRFKEDTQPSGWIWVEEYKEICMKNSKRWYNDGIKNYYITLPNSIITDLGLVKGRIR